MQTSSLGFWELHDFHLGMVVYLHIQIGLSISIQDFLQRIDEREKKF